MLFNSLQCAMLLFEHIKGYVQLQSHSKGSYSLYQCHCFCNSKNALIVVGGFFWETDM